MTAAWHLPLFPPHQWGLSLEAAVFAIAITVVVVALQLSQVPRRELGWLAVVVAAGALLRWALAPATLLDMSNYEREPVLFRWFQQLGQPLTPLFPDGWDRFRQILALDLVVSCVLPLVVFVHARVCFEDRRVPLYAALLFALCPIPIYFAHSDNLYVTSALLSSLTFVLLHVATGARWWLEEVLAGLAALVLFSVTLAARQENFLFGGLALVPAAFVLRARTPGWWHRVLWPLGTLGLALHLFWQLSASQAGEGASAGDTLAIAFRIWTPEPLLHLFWTNDYLVKPWLLPLGFAALAALGLRETWRRTRPSFAYVTWWFALFYLGHGIIPAWDDTAATRYAMHTIIPVCFAAAFGLVRARESFAARWAPATSRRRVELGVVVLFVAATTWWGFGLFRQGPSDVQEEYAFLRSLTDAGHPEEGALVIESYGNYARLLRDEDFVALKTVNRFDYFGVRARDGRNAQVIASARTFVPGHGGPTYLYLGLPCLWLRRDRPLSAACAAALSWAKWEKVASHTIAGRRHDNANGDDARGGEVALYRLSGPAPEPPPTPVDEQAADSDVPLNPVRR